MFTGMYVRSLLTGYIDYITITITNTHAGAAMLPCNLVAGNPMKAIVKRIVDGDTLILDIQMGVIAVPTHPLAADNLQGMGFYIDAHGMLVMAKVRARLYDFYAAEVGTKEGLAAKTRLELALPVGTEVQLELHGRDKYGRWLVVPIVGRTATHGGTNICLSLGKANGKPKGRGVKAQGVPDGKKAAPK